MSQPLSLSDGCLALCQCQMGKPETEKDDPQHRLRCHVYLNCSLWDERAVGDRIIKRKQFFQVRPG